MIKAIHYYPVAQTLSLFLTQPEPYCLNLSLETL